MAKSEQLPNQTNIVREAMIVAYYPDGTQVGEFMNPSRINDAKGYLGSRKTGDLADSELKHGGLSAIEPIGRRQQP